MLKTWKFFIRFNLAIYSAIKYFWTVVVGIELNIESPRETKNMFLYFCRKSYY